MKDYETHTMTWQGIDIEIGWTPEYFEYCDGTTTGHLEIRSLKPKHEPLPMTKTGYLSHWITPERLERNGGLITYIEMWLERASKTKDWVEFRTKRNQLELF